jgi:hypothetical protein
MKTIHLFGEWFFCGIISAVIERNLNSFNVMHFSNKNNKNDNLLISL